MLFQAIAQFRQALAAIFQAPNGRSFPISDWERNWLSKLRFGNRGKRMAFAIQAGATNQRFADKRVPNLEIGSQRAFMTSWLACASICLLCLATLSAAEPVDNLLANCNLPLSGTATPGALPPTFSTWSEVQDHPVAKVYLSQNDKAAGKTILCIERLERAGNERVRLGPTIPVEPGKRYYFSCLVKATEGGPGVMFEPSDAARKFVEKAQLLDPSTTTPAATVEGRNLSLIWALVDPPDQFLTLDMAFTIPDGVHYLTILAHYSHTMGTAWFTDFKLLRLE